MPEALVAPRFTNFPPREVSRPPIPASIRVSPSGILTLTACCSALIAAVRKEVIEDYAGVLSAAGANPEFTVSAFARELLCPSPGEPHAIVDVGRGGAELVFFENGVATALKILPANGDLARAVLENAGDKTLYVAEKMPTQNRLWEKLSLRPGCLRLEIPAGDGATAATLGLHKSVSENVPLPRLQAKPLSARGSFSLSRVDFSRAENRRWLARAAALLVVLLLLPYAEALLLKPVLGWQLAGSKSTASSSRRWRSRNCIFCNHSSKTNRLTWTRSTCYPTPPRRGRAWIHLASISAVKSS